MYAYTVRTTYAFYFSLLDAGWLFAFLFISLCFDFFYLNLHVILFLPYTWVFTFF